MKCYARKLDKFKYKLAVSMGNDGSGHYPRKYKTVENIRNKGQLEEAKAQFIYELSHGLNDDRGSMLFADLIEDWKRKHVPDLSPRTWEGYESNLRLRIMPSFATMRIGKIKKFHVMDFFDKLKQPDCEFLGKKYNLSAASIKNHLTCLNSIFSFAVDREYIKESPVKGVKTPSVKKKKPTIYQKQDLADLFNALQEEPLLWQAIVWLAIGTGAREGEIAALDRSKVNLEAGYTEIVQAAICKKGEGVVIKSTKTGRERTDIIPGEVLPVLKNYDEEREADKDGAGDTWVMEWKGKPCDFFFTPDGGFGRPMRPDSISQWWIRFLDKHKLKRIKFHALRHTSVSLSIDAGDTMKAISERVGHAKIGTTMDIYGQLLMDAPNRSAQLLDKQFREIKKMQPTQK
jgi:integrase